MEIPLIVLLVGLALCIKDTGPIFRFKGKLVVDIHLNFYLVSGFPHLITGNTSRDKESTHNLSNNTWTPIDGTSRFETEF